MKFITPIKKKTADLIIKSFFAQFKALVGPAVYKIYVNKLVIQVPYYMAKSKQISKIGDYFAYPKIRLLSKALNYVFFLSPSNKKLKDTKKIKMDFEIKLIKLRYPYLDSVILAQYLAINSSKYNFTRLKKAVFRNVPTTRVMAEFKTPQRFSMVVPDNPTWSEPEANLFATSVLAVENGGSFQFPSFRLGTETGEWKFNLPCGFRGADLSMMERLNSENRISTPPSITGVKIELSGRLTTQRSIPRKTVFNSYVGAFSVNHKLNTSLEFKQYTSKNKLGAYTIKIWLSNSI